jgi:hypothetical protein
MEFGTGRNADADTKMIIESTGEVGIGTDSPSSALHVNSGGTNVVGVFESTDSIASIAFKDNSTTSTSHVNIGADANDMIIITGGTEKVRIEDNGNVGIGTSSPSELLHVSGGNLAVTNNSGISLNTADATYAKIQQSTSSADILELTSFGSMQFSTDSNANSTNKYFIWKTDGEGSGGSELMSLSETGTLSIASTSTNVASLAVTGTGAASELKIQTTTNNANGTIKFGDVDDDDIGYIQYGHSANYLRFGTNTQERMRIDSNGALLVGTTNISSGTGISLASEAFHVNTANGFALFRNVRADSAGNALILDRNNGDGDLLNLRKANSSQGDIGVIDNDIYIDSTDEGRLHVGGTGRYSWSNTLFGPQNDNARDLGSSGARWKDAYLSGSLYVGGTAAANALDDYEEGTFSVTVDNLDGFSGSPSSTSFTYTKIGNKVFCEGSFNMASSSGNVTVGDSVQFTSGSLPFTPSSLGTCIGVAAVQSGAATGDNCAMGYVALANTGVYGVQIHTVNGTVARATKTISFKIAYETAA